MLVQVRFCPQNEFVMNMSKKPYFSCFIRFRIMDKGL